MEKNQIRKKIQRITNETLITTENILVQDSENWIKYVQKVSSQ